MTKQTWAERLTPFTGGAAIAVLIVALVVQPSWGQNGTVNTCIQCLAYYEYACTNPPNNVKDVVKCGPTPTSGGQQALYKWRACVDDCKSKHCAGPGKPCPGKDIPDSLRDCSSGECNLFDGIPGVSLCDSSCWSRPCTTLLIIGTSCLDVPQLCKITDPTPKCWACTCTNN